MKVIVVILILIATLYSHDNLEKVSLQLKWKYQFQFAGFIAAKEKGFYKEAGLDVDLLEYDASVNTLKRMRDGKIDFAVSDSALILEAIKGASVVAMMAIYQKSPYVLMGMKSSNINNFEDLNGKKLAIYDDINGMAIKSMLKAHSVQFTQVSVDDKLAKLQRGEVDGIIAYISNEPFVAKEMGMDITIINPNDYGFERYGDILFTSKKFLEERPKLVEKMYQASYRGFEYAFEHIDEMVELIFQKYNTQNKSRDALRYEADTLKKLSSYGKDFGELSQEKVESIAYIYSFTELGKYDFENLNDFIYKQDKSVEQLTKEELEYLKNKKIKVCVHPDLYPFEFMQDNKHKGISADLVQLMTEKYPFEFEIIPAKNDKEVFQNVFTNKCDLKPAVVHKYNMVSEYLDETSAIFNAHFVLLGNNNRPFIDDMSLLAGKKIGVRYKAYKDFMQDNYPMLETILIPDMQTMIERLNRDEIYGFIEPSLFANIIIQKYGFDVLKVNMKLSPYVLELVMGVSKKEPQLLTIINKLLKNTPKNEIDNIKTRWTVQTQYQIKEYALVWKIVFISLFTILVVLYWTIKYKREIYRREIAEQSLRDLNLSLKERIEVEVEKNKEQQLIMMQQSRHAQMGEMISMIAHQWRQPLNNLSMIIQGAALKHQLGKFNDELMTKLSADAQKQIMQMSQTIDDFRYFFKPDKIEKEFSINTTILHILGLLKPILKQKNITIETYFENDVIIKGFSNELGQALINILNNAKDALVENNSCRDKLITIVLKKEIGNVIIMIEDNAGGIKDDIIAHIFDPYFSTKEKKNGTGLGLYMSKNIIEEHCHGRISVENGNNGAIFKIELKEVL